MDIFANGTNSTTWSEGTDPSTMTAMRALAAILDPRSIQSPTTAGLTAIAAALITFLVSALWRPTVHGQSPKFTADTYPLIGSLGFLLRQWSFWQGATAESDTGHFSFWMGKRHVVGISGSAARKLFFDHPALEFVSAATLVPFGPHFMNGKAHVIFRDGFHTGRHNSFFLRRLTRLLKTEELEKHLPGVLRDTRADIKALLANNPSGVTYAPAIWTTVVKHNTRLFFTDTVLADPKKWQRLVGLMDTCLHTYSLFNVSLPWLPTPEIIKRRLMRYGLQRFTTEILDERMAPGAPRRDDPVQMLLDNVDRKEFMVEFFFSTVFITSANAHAVTGQMLNVLAIHTDWQERIYNEIKQAAETHSKRKHATLIEQLDMMPLSAWESCSPSLDLCISELLRMWASFSAVRHNTGDDPIPIPGSNEVIPPRTFAIYNTSEVHFDEQLYSEPTKFDPERFSQDRQEFKKETYGYLGWGSGLRPCMGMRWAKLQQAIIVAYALAMYKWSPCDKDGQPDPYAKHRKDLDSARHLVLPPAFCKLTPREDA